ncbi:fasciclin domain-containing protein [Flavobacteriaceae bacterium XHP0103]|uniref:fasciclin domain-containing protein n=1 Tax=Marixanthotalea marina TaxID=2844359 RepID=UPI002989F14E|nr:fasciclin domain-containing protein [Marixanthotalea marina]MBU3821360.1 fasciclin domain-containing protein [Marixanthotalea marina]
MKTLKHFTKTVILLLSVVLMTSCSTDNDDNDVIITEELTIVELASISPNLSSLVSALQAANGDLVSVLNGPGPFTVLAPTNTAFQTLLDSNPNWNSISDIDPAVLQQVLLNHVISGNVTSTDLSALGSGYAKTNANGAGDEKLSLYFDTSGGVTFNNAASVVQGGADIVAKNGVVHVIDNVIGLPTIATHVTANSNFSALAGTLTTDLVNTLNGSGSFTVFAPNNNAFGNLASVPSGDELVNLLLNHVIDGVVKSSDLVNAAEGYTNTLATGPGMNNLSLYFNTSDGVKFNGLSTVTETDIVATNGIIHAVDEVITLPTIATFATSNSALSTLVDVLVYADTGTPTVPYIATVSDATAGPFTVFAPTNDAFVSLLEDDLMANALTDIDTDTVDAVLLNHIVNANVQSSALTSGTVSTLGGDITVDASAFTLTDANGRVSNIITSLVDIQGINGVVHVIDKVILPAP